MIIECGQCKSKFELDEGMLKEEGSKVRCSICQNVFTAYPPSTLYDQEQPQDQDIDEDLQETVTLDSPPVLEEEPPVDSTMEEIEEEFDKAFHEAMGDDVIEAVSLDEIPEEEEEKSDIDEARNQVTKIEEDVTKADAEEKVVMVAQEEAEEIKTVAPKKKKGRSWLFTIIIVIIIVILGGTAAVYFLAPGLIPDSLSFLKPQEKQDVTDPGVRRLSFKSVSGSFVDSIKLGQLFVIKGMVSNDYPKSRSMILVKGTVLDDKGAVVQSKIAYAGNILPEAKLKDMPLETINEALKNRLGMGGVNRNIKPGASIPFMIVFNNLPDNLSEFTVEAVSSAPGQ